MPLVDSRSNENVFVAVNRNCKKKWKKAYEDIDKAIIFSKTLEERQKWYDRKNDLKSRIHCNCDKAYPINWLVPNYYQFEGVNEYNYNWSGREEFDEAYENGKVTRPYQELSKKEKKLLVNRKLQKPKHLVKTDLIRICPFTVPNNAKNKEIFEKEFLKYAFEARREHRWLIMNPLMFSNADHKFKTISVIIEKIKVWADQHWQPMTPESVAQFRGTK